MSGALLSVFCAPPSWASNGVQAKATATAPKNTLILVSLFLFFTCSTDREFLLHLTRKS
jgi:hypothetical protein